MNSCQRSKLAKFLTIAFATASLGVTDLSVSELFGDEKSAPLVIDTQATEKPPTTGEEAVAKMQVPEGFRVQLFSSEPDVHQPIGFTIDERGRLWVAENHTYAEAGVNFDLRFHDRIVILEDSNGDGKADRRKVFWDKGQHLTAVAVGFGGVWALAAPQLLFIPDRDRDDVPDGEPIVVLDGWNTESVRHNIVNGLTWGPDGWLYGRHGILATSFVGKPGTSSAQRTQLNCGIWRYHPMREVFEAVAHGTTNPWGFDFDDHGQMFFINTVIGHLWHIVPGAHYRRMYGIDFNPHVYQLLEQCADHFHWDTVEQWSDVRKGVSDRTAALGGGHAHCGLMIYLGDNWPDEYRGGVFTINLHGLRLNHDHLERNASSYVAKHGKDFLFANDSWFRGIELIYGPDGGVYIADWSDIGECHDNDGIHRSTGRIYKVTYGSPSVKPFDLGSLSNAELVQLQSHKNDWYVRTARRLLHERAAAGDDLSAAHADLQKMFAADPDVTRRLRAMWCLALTNGLSEQNLQKLLADENEHVRAWAVRFLSDGPEISAEVASRFAEQKDTAPLVRLFLASAMQKMRLEDRWAVAKSLVRNEGDDEDPMLPLMIWYGIEEAIPSNPQAALQLIRDSRITIVRRFASRRLTEEIEHLPQAIEGLTSIIGESDDPRVQTDVLQGMQDALRGWRKAPKPKSWDAVAQAIAAGENDSLKTLVRDLSVVFGDGRALDELRQMALSDAVPIESRRNALRVLVENRSADLFPLLEKLSADRNLINDVIRGLATCSEPQVPSIVLSKYDGLDGAGREEAINTLVSRPASAKALLAAIEKGKIDRRDVTAFHARQIRSFGNDALEKDLVRLWGDIRESQKDKQQLVGRLKSQLTAETLQAADRSNGRLLFAKNCATCHKLFGTGSTIAPDLTGANRQNMDYLLENIVDPSATMAADFKVSVISLEDGRVVTGVIVGKTSQTMTVQTQKERLTLNLEDVAETVLQNVSLMPEGLLSPLSPEQVRDLIAYISGRNQVALPSETAAGP